VYLIENANGPEGEGKLFVVGLDATDVVGLGRLDRRHEVREAVLELRRHRFLLIRSLYNNIISIIEEIKMNCGK